jgi:hypothetical protein
MAHWLAYPWVGGGGEEGGSQLSILLEGVGKEACPLFRVFIVLDNAS